MKALVLLAAVSAALAAAGAAPGCDSASCALVTRGQNGVFARGGGRIDLSLRYVDEDARLSENGPVDEVVRAKVDFERGVIVPGYHRETGGTEAFLQLDGAYGLTERLTLVATVPLITHRSFEHVHAVPGDPAQTESVPFTSEGFGDIWLGGRYALAPGLVGGASVKAPTGNYREHGDFDGSIDDPSLQPGTGSFDFLGSLQYQTRVAGLDGALSGSYLVTTRNSLEFQFGHEALVAAGVSRRLFGNITGSLQLKGHYRGRAQFMAQDVPSTGETSAHLAPGLRVDMEDRASVYVFAQVPLYRHVNEQQLAATFSVICGFAKAF
jgi:hypothetical protein